jgi:hypothetical protein
MSRNIWAVMLVPLILTAPVTLDAYASEQKVPENFHGVWQLTTGHQVPTCLEIDSDIRMTVRAERLDFFEGVCDVTGIDRQGENAFKLKADCAQEGSTWSANQDWALEQVGSETFIKIRTFDGAGPQDFSYGQCDRAPKNAKNDSASSDASICYQDDLSRLSIRSNNSGQADMEMEATFNRHVCWVHGPVSQVEAGFLYEATLEDDSQCELTIALAKDGSVSFKDRNKRCREFHCGARASFEDIKISAKARRQCVVAP